MSASMTSKFLSTNILFLDLFFFVNFLIFSFVKHVSNSSLFYLCIPSNSLFSPGVLKGKFPNPPTPLPPKKRLKQSFQTKGNFTKQKGEMKLTLSPPLPRLKDFFFLLSKSPNKEAPLRGVGGSGYPVPL